MGFRSLSSLILLAFGHVWGGILEWQRIEFGGDFLPTFLEIVIYSGERGRVAEHAVGATAFHYAVPRTNWNVTHSFAQLRECSGSS